VYWSGNEPTIFLRDLELIKKVQVTDAHEYFSDFGFQPYHDNPPNQFGLADLKGERWWKMKRSVTPSFSTPRLKKNVPAMNEAAHKLVGYLHSIEDKEFVEAIDFLKKYYLNCIANVGFGFNIDCFDEKKSEFEKQSANIFSITNFLIQELFPTIGRALNLTLLDKKFEKYLTKLTSDIVKRRGEHKLQYNDMLNNLIEVSKVNPDMTNEVMAKTCVQFLSDGYESAAMVMAVLVYYLVVYPEVQSRLQEEIDELFDGKDEGEDLTQDDITGMAYLDQVLNEGNRLGSVSSTARMCTKDYPIPGDSFVIPKNTRVIILSIGLHLDPAYWPEPNKFDPERFSSDNKGSIDPVTFQTFGGGPRQCLGKNVYIVETKVLIVHLLRNFSLKPYGDMPKELVWDMNAFIGASKYEIKLEKRDH